MSMKDHEVHTYSVEVRKIHTVQHDIEVLAKNEEEAKEKAVTEAKYRSDTMGIVLDENAQIEAAKVEKIQ